MALFKGDLNFLNIMHPLYIKQGPLWLVLHIHMMHFEKFTQTPLFQVISSGIFWDVFTCLDTV